MGIINLSPDSFYPESRVPSVTAALQLAERMIEEGADYLDVGAESSRPGAKPISEDEELAIVVPVISQLCKSFPAAVSVDTYKPGVAQRVLEEGVSIINDITGLRYPEMAPIIAEYDAGVIIMHMPPKEKPGRYLEARGGWEQVVRQIQADLTGAVVFREPLESRRFTAAGTKPPTR